MGICFGTVRLKTNAGEVVGTVRVKEGEAEGTIRYIGTVRIKDGKETIESESQVPVCYSKNAFINNYCLNNLIKISRNGLILDFNLFA